jgi:hypothetical protein
MGKKVYTINGKMYIVDDNTGEVGIVHIDKLEPVSPDLKELIKLLAKEHKSEY